MAENKVIQFTVGEAKATYTFGDSDPVKVKFNKYSTLEAKSVGDAINIFAAALAALGELNIAVRREAKKMPKTPSSDIIDLDDLPY